MILELASWLTTKNWDCMTHTLYGCNAQYTLQQWYFVTKIVLIYGEKKLF